MEALRHRAEPTQGRHDASVPDAPVPHRWSVRSGDGCIYGSERPGVALAITRTFAGRLREALALVEDLAFRDVTSRLAKILLEGQDAAPRVTQELLAAMAGSRREVVGRALKALSQDGAVKLERGRIHVCDRQALERLAWM